MKLLKHPNTVFLYGIFGAVLGGLVGPFLYMLPTNWLWTTLNVNYRGFASLLGGFLTVMGMAFGGVTGCILVHTFGKYRRLAAGGAIFLVWWRLYSYCLLRMVTFSRITKDSRSLFTVLDLCGRFC